MGSDRVEIAAAYADLAAAHAVVAGLDYSRLTVPEILELQSRREELLRRDPVIDHALTAQLVAQSSPKSIGAKNWPEVMRTRLRISGREARRRLRDAANLGPRAAMSGERLAPRRQATAAAQVAGLINQEHVDILDKFVQQLPGWVDATTATQAEEKLVEVASGHSPEALRRAADQLLFLLNQDGEEPIDAECHRKRGVSIHKQASDGMSKISGWLTPELRATLDAVLAKLAAPGMCNPDDGSACITGVPSEEAMRADTRNPAQRIHDGLLVMTRDVLMAETLGQHNGLPVSIIVTTTLQELEAGAGIAVTAGGSKLPIPDLIRLAAHAHHYLAVFDKATGVPLHLGRTKRIASPGQRLMLFARDRGCTRPGCTASGYRCQAHHAKQDFTAGGQTNIDELALACGPDNRLVTNGGWCTTIGKDGRCEWIPPRLLDTGQARVNNMHHPQLYLTETDKGGDDDGESDCQSA